MNTINDLQQITKDSIAILADKARENIIQNKYLLEKINIFKNEIITVKNLINNFWLNSNQQKINNIIASKYKEQLSLFNSNLKEEINKGQQKLKLLQKNSLSELSIEDRTLSQLSIDNFILNNTLSKLNSTTQSLNESIETSKKHEIFREPKRESIIDIKQSKTVFPVYNLELQQKMLSYCRAYSKYRYKNAKKLIKINIQKQNINALIDFIKTYTSKLAEVSQENKPQIKNSKIPNNSNINNKIIKQKGKSKGKKLKRTKTKSKFTNNILEQKLQEPNIVKSNDHRQNTINKKNSLNISINNIFNSDIKT